MFKSLIKDKENEIENYTSTLFSQKDKITESYQSSIHELENNFKLMSDSLIKESTKQICDLEEQCYSLRSEMNGFKEQYSLDFQDESRKVKQNLESLNDIVNSNIYNSQK